MTPQTDQETTEVYVLQEERERIHIDQGKKEIIEAFVKSYLKGGIKEIQEGSIEDLITAVEKMICFEHNKQGRATEVNNNSLAKYFKEAEKKQKKSVKIPKNSKEKHQNPD